MPYMLLLLFFFFFFLVVQMMVSSWRIYMGLRIKLNYPKCSFFEVEYKKFHAKGDVLGFGRCFLCPIIWTFVTKLVLVEARELHVISNMIDHDYVSLESVVQNVEMHYVEWSWDKVRILSKGWMYLPKIIPCSWFYHMSTLPLQLK